MKIGIMTFWESQDNYGQQLQAFALQTYLRSQGHDVFLIKYHRHGGGSAKRTLLQRLMNFNPYKSFKARLAQAKQRQFNTYDREHPRYFDAFKQKYLNLGDRLYVTLDELKADPPKAEAYICGSDQVWNNSFSVSCEPYLLGFGSNSTLRISYAASFGQSELSLETKRMFQKYLPHFDAISVRERKGASLCQEMGYPRAYWVPDPTMLFDKSQWLSQIEKPNKFSWKKGKRLFLYTLGNSQIESREVLINHLKSLDGVESLHVSANRDMSGNFFPGIEEWIHTLASADFVVTNSFHGAVFSILFNKNFVVLPNTGQAKGMNERVISLLEKLNLSDHLLHQFSPEAIEKLFSKDIPWQEVDAAIAGWREEAANFLATALAAKR